MSTRANIIVKDSNSTVYLYRHCDGYPEGLGSEIQEFLNNIKDGNWLSFYEIVGRILTGGVDDVRYTDCIHWDIEYKYIIEIQETPKLRIFERKSWDYDTTKEEAWEEIFPGFLGDANGRTFKPKTREELLDLVNRLIEERGLNADLNDIDISLITDMSFLFCESEFNGDISKWDVSKVENMTSMFFNSKFTGDISNWNVGNVKVMRYMFAYSKFNGDISKWDVSKVKRMDWMFYDSPLDGKKPEWYKYRI
jgi:hypothetical protein